MVCSSLWITARDEESDGMWVGNYTDPRVGFGFNYDKLNVRFEAGPRFYVPGSYSV